MRRPWDDLRCRCLLPPSRWALAGPTGGLQVWDGWVTILTSSKAVALMGDILTSGLKRWDWWVTSSKAVGLMGDILTSVLELWDWWVSWCTCQYRRAACRWGGICLPWNCLVMITVALFSHRFWVGTPCMFTFDPACLPWTLHVYLWPSCFQEPLQVCLFYTGMLKVMPEVLF